MAQKVLSIEVFNADGSLLFSKSPAMPQDIVACVGLFDLEGMKIVSQVKVIDLSSKAEN